MDTRGGGAADCLLQVTFHTETTQRIELELCVWQYTLTSSEIAQQASCCNASWAELNITCRSCKTTLVTLQAP